MDDADSPMAALELELALALALAAWPSAQRVGEKRGRLSAADRTERRVGDAMCFLPIQMQFWLAGDADSTRPTTTEYLEVVVMS